MLTFAGQELVVVTEDLASKVREMLSTDNIYEHSRTHWNANEPFPDLVNYQCDHPVEVGRLYWPSGASRWAVGHFLVYQTEAEAIEAACWPTATSYLPADLVMTWEEDQYSGPLVTSTDTVDTITAEMYPLPLRPFATDDGRGFYLLTLVDRRFFWWSKNPGAMRTLPGGVVNLLTLTAAGSGFTSQPTVTITGDGTGATAEARIAADKTIESLFIKQSGSGYTTAAVTITGGGGSGATATATVGADTWPTAYGKLTDPVIFSLLTKVPKIEAISADYLAPTELLRLDYSPIPPWLDTVAYNIGQRIVLSLDGDLTFQNPVSTAPTETEGVQSGGTFLGTVPSSYPPLTSRVLFPKYTGSQYLNGYLAKSHSGNGAIGEAPLYSFVKATYAASSSASPTNDTALQTYADKWGTDFDLWLQGDRDLKLAGIVNVVPNGTYGNIIWTYKRDELSTRVQPCDYPVRSLPPTGSSGINYCRMESRACLQITTGPSRKYSPAKVRMCGHTCLITNTASNKKGAGGYLVLMCSRSCLLTTPSPRKLAAGTGISIATSTTTYTISASSPIGTPQENLLINGGFDYAQRQDPTVFTTIADRTYGPDRWKCERESAGLQYQRVSGLTETGISSKFYGQFKKTTNSSQFVFYQFVEGQTGLPLRGNQCTIHLKLRSSASHTIHYALLTLGSGGTLDTLPVPLVSAYGGTSTNPTWGANITVVGSVSFVSTGPVTWSETSTGYTGLSTSSKNWGVAVWSYDHFAVNDTLDVAEAQLYISDGAFHTAPTKTWYERQVSIEQHLCQHFYLKSFELDTVPAQNSGAGTGETIFAAGKAGALTEVSPRIIFPTAMFPLAAPTVTLYNPAAANAQVRDETAAADCSATATADVRASGFGITATGNAGTAVGNALGIHWTAEAEM